MAKLSELIIQYPEVDNFAALENLVAHAGESGQMFLEFDVKPDYRDTPRNWEWKLETTFTKGLQYE